jgi:hypothetical protein
LDIKEELATEALRIVNGSRRSAYGTPERNFERIARYWDAYFKNTGRAVDITAADVSPLMRLVKEARLNENPKHRDSYVDIIGYTLTAAEVSGVRSILDELDARVAELDAEERADNATFDATPSDTPAAQSWTDPEHEDGA